MEKRESNTRREAKSSSREKVFGKNALQLSEDLASHLVGGIVEKGIDDSQQNRLFASIAPPKPSAIPFPVARHRSHGPHWDPVGSKRIAGNVNDDDGNECGDEEERLMNSDPISRFADPIQRKEKKGLDFSKWKGLAPGGKPSMAKKVEHNALGLEKTGKQGKSREEDKKNKLYESSSAKFDLVSPMDIDNSNQVYFQKDDCSILKDSPIHGQRVLNEEEPVSLQDHIDAENWARLQGMSADEIAEAQVEIMEKMNPALLKALKKRGEDKLKKQKCSRPKMSVTSESDNLQEEHSLQITDTPMSDIDISHTKTSTTSISEDTPSLLENGVQEKSSQAGSTPWNNWSERVGAVRLLRFSIPFENGEVSVCSTNSVSNATATERDFLRTEGDPGAAGYTIKEAVTLTRSVIPGQRTFGLHIISALLNKALLIIHQKQVGCERDDLDKSIDWEAIWAYALGPEPELVLALRMCLDDNHSSVALACAKVIECVLSCDMNENFFDILEKTTNYKDVHTAPIFRSKPEIDTGFLQGGYWKYSAKPSNILPFSEDVNVNEGNHTIQDDIVVAGQDFAAGMVRMGILSRLCYLLESYRTMAWEECIISILVAITRHSPTCANAIMKFQGLIDLVFCQFKTKDNMEIFPSQIIAVTLFKVLAQSDRKNCIDFIKKGAFQVMTWQLYQFTSSIDQWVRAGKESCKLQSALIVEQLRFWKVCIQYGYCVSNFSDIFPALCLWLNPPTFEKLEENNVLDEFTSISMEAFLVLEALARRLPNFFSQKSQNSQTPDLASNGTEIWSWSCVVPMVELALKWIALKRDPFILKFFEQKKESEKDELMPLIWVYSAVMKMLSTVLEKVVPHDTDINHESSPSVPWLPEFVPRVGLEIIKNGFLGFTNAYNTTYGTDHTRCSSFIEELCLLRQQSGFETSLASVSCLHGLVRTIGSIDELIKLANTGPPDEPSQGYSVSKEGQLLKDGILKGSVHELRGLLNIFTKVIASENNFVQSIETFGRGGPAPGVGIGWGAPGGGYWSLLVLLTQTNAGFFMDLAEALKKVSNADETTVEEDALTMAMVNSTLGVCLTLGPKDAFSVEKALKFLIHAPILKYLDICIRKRIKHFRWAYNEDDYLFFSKILGSHFMDRWLSIKKSKVKGNNRIQSANKKSEVQTSLETIYEEDMDASNMKSQDCTSLVVEWARQRLPLPRHWFLSPVSTIHDIKRQNSENNSMDQLEVAKGGLFFLLGIEVIATFLPTNLPSTIQTVPLIWKLHSLSMTLLLGMDVLEDKKSRDTYEALQNLFGEHLDKESTRNEAKVEFLKFQSEIHESYSTFIDTLVDQYSAVSYGDFLYGRQVALFLHRGVEASVRLTAWNALSNARVLELLPPIHKCIGKAEGYLEPIEDNEAILEAYVKSWISSALDRAVARGSAGYTLVRHHLSSYIFDFDFDRNLSLRNKLARSLLRDSSQKQHQGMMLDLVLYTKPSSSPLMPNQKDGLPIKKSIIEKRLDLLVEACERNSSLLTEVEKLKVTCNARNVMNHSLLNKSTP